LGFEKRKSQNFGQFFSKIVANKMLNLPWYIYIYIYSIHSIPTLANWKEKKLNNFL
jgi:hypothetical protein